MTYDYIVVGGGIAGLTIAELLQRSGRSVLLLEARSQLCSDASAQQHGWFHTGALYAALPSSQFFRILVGNLDDLINYYSAFPRMNLRSGRYLITSHAAGWFENTTNYYCYTHPADPAIAWWFKPLWALAALRAKSRLAWFEGLDFSRELSPQIRSLAFSTAFSRITARRRFDFDLGQKGAVLKSRDRTMNTRLIITDLVNSFLTGGGQVKLDARVARVRRGAVTDQNGTHHARHVIVAAGRGTASLSGLNLKVVQSPLLVVRPALTDVNFVRMHPVITQTINHIYHSSVEGDYSVLGSARYYPLDPKLDVHRIHREMVEHASRVFRRDIELDHTSIYFGYKTELVGAKQLRNYQYHILETEDCLVALPGKMTLAFSLAVNVCRHFGIDPCSNVPPFNPDVGADLVSNAAHYETFLSMNRPSSSDPSPGPVSNSQPKV